MRQFYIIEIKEMPNGEYEHEVTWAYDEDLNKARLKGESAYHLKLSIAAVSDYAKHSVTLISDEGFPVMYKCYIHEEETDSETETETEDEPE